MEQYNLTVKSIDKVTHDVLHIVMEKPQNFSFKPGQATEVAINKKGWKNEQRPFTFTCLPSDDFLEFTIKTYPSHEGVTNELLSLQPKDELLIGKPWGTINYQGEGTFIAGGAGVTPFISIFRQLQADQKLGSNKLLFANKKEADIIHKAEFDDMLGENFVNILSDEKTEKYAYGFITEDFLRKHLLDKKAFIYLCGPEKMMESIEKQLYDLGVDKEKIVIEEF